MEEAAAAPMEPALSLALEVASEAAPEARTKRTRSTPRTPLGAEAEADPETTLSEQMGLRPEAAVAVAVAVAVAALAAPTREERAVERLQTFL